MYIVWPTPEFKKSLERLERSGKFNTSKLARVLAVLESGGKLGPEYQDHELKGKLEGIRECHLKFDVLLMYKIIEDKLVLLLIDIGTHSDLFGK